MSEQREGEARKLAALEVLGKGGYDQFVAPWVAERDSLAAKVEALTSQLEKSQAQSLRRFNQKGALDKALEAIEQRAQRAEEKLERIEEKCVYTLIMREDMPYSEVHAILDLIREDTDD